MESFQIIPDGHVHMQKCSDGETESEGKEDDGFSQLYL